MVFPILERHELFDSFELFHMINVNKVLKNKSDHSQYLKGDYNSYLLAKQKYEENLPKFNSNLLDLFVKTNKDVIFDAIVIPSSSSEWLREGLVNTFANYYLIETFEAKKRDMSIEASRCSDDLPSNLFYFEDETIKLKNNIIILDDCYCSGKTVKALVQLLGADKNYAIACYFVDSTL